jgi:hypothetical protein
MYATNLRMCNSGSYQRIFVRLVIIEQMRLAISQGHLLCNSSVNRD